MNSIINNKLFTALLIQLACSAKGEELKNLHRVLSEHGLDTREESFERGPTHRELRRLNEAYADIMTATTGGADVIARQKNLGRVAQSTLDVMRYELFKSRTNLNYSVAQLLAVLLDKLGVNENH